MKNNVPQLPLRLMQRSCMVASHGCLSLMNSLNCSFLVEKKDNFILLLTFEGLLNILPGWILFINRAIAWWWLIFRFDAMIEMIVVHVRVIIIVVLSDIFRTALDHQRWRRIWIIVRHKIRWISVICRCWNGRYIQIRESCFVHWIRWLENITSYFVMRSNEIKIAHQFWLHH